MSSESEPTQPSEHVSLSEVQRMERFRGFFSSEPGALQRLLFFRARNASEASFLQ
ncbi:hypothetical protein A2U01_0081264, partial [Trifolium medium]|nr:hypothetical protein [Trifolium medium]